MNDDTRKLDRPLFFAGAWRPLDRATGMFYCESDGRHVMWLHPAELDGWLEEEENR